MLSKRIDNAKWLWKGHPAGRAGPRKAVLETHSLAAETVDARSRRPAKHTNSPLSALGNSAGSALKKDAMTRHFEGSKLRLLAVNECRELNPEPEAKWFEADSICLH